MPIKGQQTEIQLSKIKLLLMLVGSLTFVGLGLWFVIAPPTTHSFYRYSPTTMQRIGYASIIFFGLCALLLLRKLFDNRPGLIIDNLGLSDNSSGVAGGQILWSDIINIQIIEIYRQKIILIQVTNPQDYIDRQSNALKRKMMEMNFKKYGTPLSITSNGLNISFNDLYKLLVDNYNKVRQGEEKSPNC